MWREEDSRQLEWNMSGKWKCMITFRIVDARREHSVELTTARSTAWFTAAVSSGVLLVFINIQNEKNPFICTYFCLESAFVLNLRAASSVFFFSRFDTRQGRLNSSAKELSSSSKHQKHSMTTVEIVQGIGCCFYRESLNPSRVPYRFGRIQIGNGNQENGRGKNKQKPSSYLYWSSLSLHMLSVFGSGLLLPFYVISVARRSAADRTGLGCLYQEALENVISRPEKKRLMPSSGTSGGMWKSCDQTQVKETLELAMERSESVTIHVTAWQNISTHGSQSHFQAMAAIRPPNYHPFWIYTK